METIIKPIHNFTFELATGQSLRSTKWRTRPWTWQEFVNACAQTRRTPETLDEFRHMTREEQGTVKDAGGFVGGRLQQPGRPETATNGTNRKRCNVQSRTMVTLDLDNCAAVGSAEAVWNNFLSRYQCAALIYSTHKHTPERPRLRLCVPLQPPITSADPQPEYEAVARRIAQAVGIEACDLSTYQAERLFYWPTTSRDGQFYFDFQDGPPLDPNEILATYHSWANPAEWPLAPTGDRPRDTPRNYEARRQLQETADTAGRAIASQLTDPRLRGGVVGAFCNAYHPIDSAISHYLRHIYQPYHSTPGRYTYRRGTTEGGLVIYDGLFAYSNHGTDPAHGQCCNAFDLVRLHLFGDGPHSFAEMQQFALGDPLVKRELSRSGGTPAAVNTPPAPPIQEEEAPQASSSVKSPTTGAAALLQPTTKAPTAEAPAESEVGKTAAPPAVEAWTAQIQYNRAGDPLPTLANLDLILSHTTGTRDLQYDSFADRVIPHSPVPWAKEGDPEPTPPTWEDAHNSQLRVWLSHRYGIKATPRDLQDCIVNIYMRHATHPVRQYLESLKWDGKPRLERLLISYLGSPDTPLTRACTRKHFAAAVKRIYEPGCKYDTCLTLVGAQGTYKTTLIEIMGGRWFNNTIFNMEDKDSRQALQGSWLIELGELAGIKRSSMESVKTYLSTTEDTYRPAYARLVTRRPRQCVFFATTNEDKFLKDSTGGRRFWIIRIDPALRTEGNPREALQRDRDQLWAEALQVYRSGESLMLTDELEQEAKLHQEEVTDNDEDLEADLAAFLTRRLPANWEALPVERRRAYYRQPPAPGEEGDATFYQRREWCPQEFLSEYKSLTDTTATGFKYLTRAVAKIAQDIPGWEKRRITHGLYKYKRGFFLTGGGDGTPAPPPAQPTLPF